ncbi:MAG TPA: hypothetical protein VEU33_00485 [Archangium sp.]|nr:hypothetical protein [Archangium sp.]
MKLMVAPPTRLQQEAGPIGTRHPILFQRAAKDGRWLIACQAREDTHGDGKLEVRYGRYGDTFGDRLAPYLFLEPDMSTGQLVRKVLDDVQAVDTQGRMVLDRFDVGRTVPRGPLQGTPAVRSR